MFQYLLNFVKPFFKKPWFFKLAFNVSPMYRRSVGKITSVSKDLHRVAIQIPINYKNRNYAGSIFGGSLFSATDPIMMIQLLQILGNNYVVWDKEARIRYKIPAREKVSAVFQFEPDEILKMKEDVKENGEVDWIKVILIVNGEGQVFAEVTKVIYVASKEHYKEKIKKRKAIA